MSFTPNIPASGQTLGQTRQAILDNFAILRSTLAVDHVDVNASGNGFHKFVHLNDASSTIPTTTATQLALFNKLVSGSYRLFLRQISSGTQIQMSGIDPVASANGYTFLPGGLLLQWGSIAQNSNSNRSVSFPTPFSAAPFSISLVGTRPTANPGTTDCWVDSDTPPTASGFTIKNNGGHTFGFYWMAIGTKA